MKILLILLLSSMSFFSQDMTTWELIQSDIFDQNCTTCHYEGSSFANQSGLVLTADQAYYNLFEAKPYNTYAESDGLVRVSNNGGSVGLIKSFLWKKINVVEQEHFYNDHQNYGSLMPLGLPYLTNGQLELVEGWILAGAPEDGIVIDPSVLNDTSRYTAPEFIALAEPEQGFQLHLGPVDIWPAEKHDREFLYFEPYKTDEDLYVTGFEISMREGSHHYILYNYPEGSSTPAPNTYRDIRSQNGSINVLHSLQLNFLFPDKFFAGTQTPYYNYQLPDNVALLLPKGSGFDHNLHSTNRTTTGRPGEVYVNIHTTDKSEVKHVAYNGNFSNYNISLPPNQVTTLTKDFYFDETTHVIQLWSHAHEKMTEFLIERLGGDNNGELIYWTNDWEHPPYLYLDPPMTFNAGERVRLITTYNNWEDRTINFGPLSSDEMQFMFYIYFTGDITSVEETDEIPKEFLLSQNYPNPFNPVTAISYSVPSQINGNGLLEESVKLVVYDVLGRQIEVLVNERKEAGLYKVEFNGNNLSSGVYFYKLIAGTKAKLSRKMVLMK